MKLTDEEWACETAKALAPNNYELQVTIAMVVVCRMRGWKHHTAYWLATLWAQMKDPTSSQREFLAIASQWVRSGDTDATHRSN